MLPDHGWVDETDETSLIALRLRVSESVSCKQRIGLPRGFTLSGVSVGRAVVASDAPIILPHEYCGPAYDASSGAKGSLTCLRGVQAKPTRWPHCVLVTD